jgi:hypothetical protein
MPVYFNVKEDLKILYMCLNRIVINNFFYYFYTKENDIVKSMKDDTHYLLLFQLPEEIFSREKYKGIEHYIRNFKRFGVLLLDDVYNPDEDPFISPLGTNYEKLNKYENEIKLKIYSSRLKEAKANTFEPFIWDYKYKKIFDRINKCVTDLYERSTLLYNFRFTEENGYDKLHNKIIDIYDIFSILITKYPYYYNEEKKIERFLYDLRISNITSILYDINDKTTEQEV